MKNLYLGNRFFVLIGAVIVLFIVAFAVEWLFPVAQTAFVVLVSVLLADILMAYGVGVRVHAERRTPKVLSLGSDNAIEIYLDNPGERTLRMGLIDELPVQFQRRDFYQFVVLKGGRQFVLRYTLRPTLRGEYHFGNLLLFVESPLRLVRRRVVVGAADLVPVYPSIAQMKELELRAFTHVTAEKGIKKLRRIGHSYEFEQIKNYVRGDDYRSINWKATGRHNRLMINQYQDERSQQIYALIDKSRVMKMPFGGLSLMDHAVNAALVISNIALRKDDKAGLITFSDRIGSTLRAERKPGQLNRILSTLYREELRPLEANYEILLHAARKLIHGRSLLLLFTNFESMSALDRHLPLLRRLNNLHLLVVVLFVNTEVERYTEEPVETIRDIYTQTIARRFLSEKREMQHKLRTHGIQTILTAPEDLSVNTINKYLELKARGLI